MLYASCLEWTLQMVDIHGAFLKGEFNENEECIYLEVPQGFEHIYNQLAQELEKGQIHPSKALERATKIHKMWKKIEERHRQIIINHKQPQGRCSNIILSLNKKIHGTIGRQIILERNAKSI